MRLLEVLRALAHCRRNRHRVVRVLCEHVREEGGHPLLDAVRITLDDRAHAQDGGVELAQRDCVSGRGLVGEGGLIEKADKAVLRKVYRQL